METTTSPPPPPKKLNQMVSRKDKKHSGWVTPRLSHPGMKYSEIIEEGLEPQKMRDEWSDWRDGQRDYFKDASHFKK